MIRVQVLGSLQAQVAGLPADLGGPRQRGVLAMLLVARGDVVSVDRLIEDLWRGEPPPRAIGALQAYVSHLRRALEPDRPPRTPPSVLVSVPPGYAIRLPPQSVDAWQFEALVRSAAASPARGQGPARAGARALARPGVRRVRRGELGRGRGDQAGRAAAGRPGAAGRCDARRRGGR